MRGVEGGRGRRCSGGGGGCGSVDAPIRRRVLGQRLVELFPEAVAPLFPAWVHACCLLSLCVCVFIYLYINIYRER